MRKSIRCQNCDSQMDVEIKCDTCDKLLIYPVITLNICDVDYDFCAIKCLLKFIIAEENKNNPRNDIITGGKKC
jgi:hypothetical protein